MKYNLLIFTFILTPSLFSEDLDNLDRLIESCLLDNVLASCEMATARLHFGKRLKEALKTSEKACELSDEGCSQSYSLAAAVDKKTADEIAKKFENRCEQNANFCLDLASIYEERSNYKAALEAARKYYLKNEKGIFPYYAYKYGDKNEAFTTAMNHCKKENDRCIFYLRYMPDHPQFDEILKLSENSCKTENHGATGATDCAIVGSYYLKKANLSAAYDMWSFDCKHNYTSCLLIIGTAKFKTEQIKSALLQFCENHTPIMEATAKQLQQTHCKQIKNGPMPKTLSTEATKIVKSFLREQH